MLDQYVAQQINAIMSEILTRMQEHRAVINKTIVKRKYTGNDMTSLYRNREKLSARYVRLSNLQKAVKDHSRKKRFLTLSHVHALRSIISSIIRDVEFYECMVRMQMSSTRNKYGFHYGPTYDKLDELKIRKARLANIQRCLREHKDYLVWDI